MADEHRPVIGVLVNKFDNYFQRKVCQSISEYANSLGYDVLVFNTFANTEKGERFDIIEERMLDFAPIEHLDGIVALYDTFRICEQRAFMESNIRARAKCPIVSVRARSEGVYNVVTDDSEAMEEVVEHVLTDHKVTRVCFLSGPAIHPDAVKRLACFKRVMAKHGIPLHDNSIYFGDFWRYSAKPAADFFYSDPDWVPEAIICANDYMAISISMELTRRGIDLLHDLIITGYDNVPEAECCTPSITTVSVDCVGFAREAVDIISDIRHGKTRSKTTHIKPKLVKRDSCGCQPDDTASLMASRYGMLTLNSEMFSQQVSHVYFQADITSVADINVLGRAVHHKLSRYPDFRSYFLCLCSDGSDDIGNVEYTGELTDTVRLAFAIVDRDILDLDTLPTGQRYFSKLMLMPAAAATDSPSTYYIQLLHNRDLCFGYTVVSFYNHSVYDYSFQNTVVATSAAIDDLINRVRLEHAIKLNEKMSITDVLTGLLNRRGFEEFSKKQCDMLGKTAEALALLSIDLNGLKFINDNYGHEEGDFAIRLLGSTIRDVFGGDAITSRVGGDEFAAMLTLSQGSSIHSGIERFKRELKRRSDATDKPYKVSAAIGCAVVHVGEDVSIESMMRESDRLMYIDKRASRENDE